MSNRYANEVFTSSDLNIAQGLAHSDEGLCQDDYEWVSAVLAAQKAGRIVTVTRCEVCLDGATDDPDAPEGMLIEGRCDRRQDGDIVPYRGYLCGQHIADLQFRPGYWFPKA